MFEAKGESRAMRMKEHVKGLLRSLLLCTMVVQIVLGILWGIRNLTNIPGFVASYRVVELGQNFIPSKVLFCILCYGIQLVVAYLAAGWLAASLGIYGWMRRIGALALVTFQPALQCHMAVLQNSLLLSAGMFLLGLIFRWWKKATWKTWCLSAVLCVAGALFIIWANRGYSLEEVLMKRLCWPVMMEDYTHYPSEFTEEIEKELLFESQQYPDSLETKLFPVMSEKFSRAERKALYREMIQITLARHKGGIFKRILWDEFGYHMPSVVLAFQMTGRGAESVSGINYDLFCEQAPMLSKCFVRFEAIAMLVYVLSTIVLWAMSDNKKKIVIPAIFTFAGMELLVVYYILQGAGRMDYKNALIVSMLILALSIKTLSLGKEEE